MKDTSAAGNDEVKVEFLTHAGCLTWKITHTVKSQTERKMKSISHYESNRPQDEAMTKMMYNELVDLEVSEIENRTLKIVEDTNNGVT